MFDIDKHGKYGRTASHEAIINNNPIIVELLLKEYHANPNVVDNDNETTLMYWALTRDRKLSILTLLVKYGFDFAKLVNQRSNNNGETVFHILCDTDGNTDHNIACLKHLFSICEKIPNCSINILAQNHQGMCGLHYAIYNKEIDMTNYLLENVYFPNNDKLNKDGIACINMKILGGLSLAGCVIRISIFKEDGNVKRDLEMFKLLDSYGMKFNSEDEIYLGAAIVHHFAELVAFILDENFFPIDTLDKIVDFMYKDNGEHGSVNTEILKLLYKYGLEHGLILNKSDHKQIIIESAKYDLSTFKSTMLMILYKHGIYDLKEYKQCDIFDDRTIEIISQSSNTKPNVKSFIKALISHDETKLLKLDYDIAKSKKVVLTCINNHELKNKIITCKENCSICGDGGDGLKCNECKSFICNDCIIVQKIRKKMNDNGNNEGVLNVLANEISKYKHNKKLFDKVELIKFLMTFFDCFVFLVCHFDLIDCQTMSKCNLFSCLV